MVYFTTMHNCNANLNFFFSKKCFCLFCFVCRYLMTWCLLCAMFVWYYYVPGYECWPWVLRVFFVCFLNKWSSIFPGVKEHLRRVLIGLQGVGKSAAGNTILGWEEFLSDLSATSLTSTSERRDAVVCGRKVTVVDTPGLLNSDDSYTNKEREMERALTLCEPGPHAFLLVIQLGRFTEQERHVMDTLQKMCSNVNVFTIVLFTYGDKLKNKSVDQFVREDINLQKLIQKCHSQYHVFNNTDRENTCQASELFEKVDSQLGKRNNKYYVRTNRVQGKSWNTRHFYIAAAATVAAAALLMYAAFTKTPILRVFSECHKWWVSNKGGSGYYSKWNILGNVAQPVQQEGVFN